MKADCNKKYIQINNNNNYNSKLVSYLWSTFKNDPKVDQSAVQNIRNDP